MLMPPDVSRSVAAVAALWQQQNLPATLNLDWF